MQPGSLRERSTCSRLSRRTSSNVSSRARMLPVTRIMSASSQRNLQMTPPFVAARIDPIRRICYNQEPCARRHVAQQRRIWSLAMQTKPTLTSHDAKTIAARCLEAARRHDVCVSIAVVDEAGKLLHFERMDDARGHTGDLAIRKAQT